MLSFNYTSDGGVMHHRKVIHNGNIITMDETLPHAEAVVVVDDRIEFVGSSAQALASAAAGTETVDLGGATLVPGFNDNHIHVIGLGFDARQLHLNGLDTEQIVTALLDRFGSEKKGKLIIAGGWDYPACPEPHKRILDEAFPHNPVLLIQFGGHAFWANSLTLKKIKERGKSGNTLDAKFLKDSSGETTGIVRGANGYMRRSYLGMFLNTRLIRDFLLDAFEMLRRAGLTSVQDNTWIFTIMNVLNRLYVEDELTCRMSCWFFGEAPALAFLMKLNKFNDLWYHRGPWKYFLDGTFSARTAWLFEPYADEGENCGQGKDTQKIERLLLANLKKNRQAAFHAIGDRTIKEFVDAVVTLRSKNPSFNDLRFRLEHAQLIRAEDISRLRDNNILIAAQPSALATPEKDINLLGKERAGKAYPYRSLLDAGVHLSFGSDFPGEALYYPLELIHLAVNRESDERITPLEALRCYTIESAYAETQEAQKGSVSVGKLADFTVLSDDPTAVDPAKIKDIKVECTIVGGKEVYRRPATASTSETIKYNT